MILVVSMVMNRKYMLGKYFQSCNTFVTSARYDGYMILHNTMKMVHPILMEYAVEFKIPKHVNNNILLVHLNTFMNFLKREYLQGINLLITNSLTCHLEA